MRRSRVRKASPHSLSPSPSLRDSSPETPSSTNSMSLSRPASASMMPPSRPPTLQEILSDAAPPPWTLSAFMAYLSQNHCLETLEFVMDAERYRGAHIQISNSAMANSSQAAEHLCELWQRLMQAYVVPYGVREVNFPAPVRDRLLTLPCHTSPPDPSTLDEAITIVQDLMTDSVLAPFIQSMQPEYPPMPAEYDARHGRSRSRQTDPSLQTATSLSPPAQNPSASTRRRSDGQYRSASSSSTEAGDRAGLVDDRGSNSPSLEPMTPPTTPPTSDWAFPARPAPLSRAISSHSSGWKKMGAKLGFGKKGKSSRQSNPTYDNYDPDYSEPSPSNLGPL